MYELLVCPAIAVPLVGTVYHRYCPAVPPEAFNVKDDVPQAEAPVAPGVEEGEFIWASTEVRGLSQVPLLMETK